MILAAATQPGTVLAIVLAGTGVLMFAIRALGLILERSHPSVPGQRAVSKQAAAPAPSEQVSLQAQVPGVRDPELVAVIAAATAMVITQPHRIVAVSEPKKPSVESLMQVWSWEGRRQIYSSHRVR